MEEIGKTIKRNLCIDAVASICDNLNFIWICDFTLYHFNLFYFQYNKK